MGWSQPGGGCGNVHRTTVLSGALERQLASAPPSWRCRMAVLPIPPRRAPAQWVRQSGVECECGIVAPMPPPRPNPTPAHPSAHPPSFDDPMTSASNDEDEDHAMALRDDAVATSPSGHGGGAAWGRCDLSNGMRPLLCRSVPPNNPVVPDVPFTPPPIPPPADRRRG
jgi:hypothetical protein